MSKARKFLATKVSTWSDFRIPVLFIYICRRLLKNEACGMWAQKTHTVYKDFSVHCIEIVRRQNLLVLLVV